MGTSKKMLWLTALLAVAACDCGDGEDGDTGPTGDTGRDAIVVDRGPVQVCRNALPVDMLWVVDNSNSMKEEQLSLAFNFPILIDTLTNPPDSDRDGEPDFPPVQDLRLGVITTDMGVGEANVDQFCPSAVGDEGKFISASRATMGDCAGVDIGTPAWLDFDGSNGEVIADQFGCIAQLGTDGCGLEQQLEASLSAITTQAGSGGPNADFFRPESLIAIIYVTDEDDCSAADDSIFSPSPEAEATLGHRRTRCADHPEMLHESNRYIAAFRNLTLDRKGDVIVGAITGVPRDLTADPINVDFNAVLADERMQYRKDPADDTKLVPACETAGVGFAPPARRIVEVVRDFAGDGNAVLSSICEPDLKPAIESIAKLVAGKLCGAPI